MCSATCGEGWQSRTRFCVSSSYSTQCSGPLREQRPCNNSAVCPGKPSPPPSRPPPLLPRLAVGPTPSSTPDPPLHPSSTSRLRVYARLAVASGPGDVQDPGPGRSSEQSDVLFVSHIPAALLPVNGAWDEWSPWSLCSSTCGRGFRSRTRTCTPPQFGGEPCVGPEKQTKFCNIAVCPGGSLPCTLMHVSPVC